MKVISIFLIIILLFNTSIYGLDFSGDGDIRIPLKYSGEDSSRAKYRLKVPISKLDPDSKLYRMVKDFIDTRRPLHTWGLTLVLAVGSLVSRFSLISSVVLSLFCYLFPRLLLLDTFFKHNIDLIAAHFEESPERLFKYLQPELESGEIVYPEAIGIDSDDNLVFYSFDPKFRRVLGSICPILIKIKRVDFSRWYI